MRSLLYRSRLACFILLAAFYGCTHPPVKYGQNPAAGKFMPIRGFKMYYEVYGEGKPLLLIHGNGGSGESMANQVPYFAQNYKVILADSRAQGRSADLTDSLSYDMMADDLAALLDGLHLDSAYVIGWSDGGINGLLLAIRHPEKVKKLAITGTNLWPDSTALHPYVYKDIANNEKRLRDSIQRSGETPELKNAYKVNHMMLVAPHIKLEQLHQVKVPTLVIAGDHDAINTRHTVEIAEALPNAYLWIIPGTGHSTPVRQKEQFNATVGDFFAKPFTTIEGSDRYN